MANKAGLSLRMDEHFSIHINDLMTQRHQRVKPICEAAQISERMFHYFKRGVKPSKETLLAFSIALELEIDAIQRLLRMAGYFLSYSIPNDTVVLWMLTHYKETGRNENKLRVINETLDALGLPMLGTRYKRERSQE